MKYNISARGVLEKGSEILFIEFEDSIGKYYSLPGGTQEIGDSLSSTVIREFKEETCLDVEVKELFMIREFILETSTIPTWEAGIHQVEAIFICSFVDEKQKHGIGSVPDGGMLGLKWIDKKDFKKLQVVSHSRPSGNSREEKCNVSFY